MNKSLLFALFLILTALTLKAQTSTETPEAYQARMQWWHDARFGMFIHWGAYSVPAGVHNGIELPSASEWIMATGNITPKEYEQYPARFNPINFDADAWVKTARDAGMKYLVITSKHHDGFCIWDSKITGYDVMDFAPYKHDPLKDLSKACKKYGIRFGLYHSIMDWHHPWASGSTFSLYRDEYLIPQLEELIKNYDPEILWFDGEWIDEWTEAQGRDLYNHLRKIKPSLIINNRVGKGRNGMQGMNTTEEATGDFGTPEQEILSSSSSKAWESCMTMNDSWGFKKNDHNWKSSEQLIHNLIDIVAKGGNYLLNVGPDSLGIIPPESVERLQDVGNWLKINGKAIYTTQAVQLFNPDPTIRICKEPKGSRYYILLTEYPTQAVVIPSLKPLKNTKIKLLTNKESIPYSYQDQDGLRIELPAYQSAFGNFAWVLELEAEEVAVAQAPTIKVMTGETADEILFSRSTEARIFSDDTSAQIRFTVDGSPVSLQSPVYTRPILISRSQTITAVAYCKGKNKSLPASLTLIRIDDIENVKYLTDYSPKYAGKGKFTLFDGKFGSIKYQDKNWLGFENKDAELMVNFGIVRKLTSIDVSYLNDPSSWIFAPLGIEIEASVNGQDYYKLGAFENVNKASNAKETSHFLATFEPNEARYLRLKIVSPKVCPKGHAGEGQPAWIFLDELKPGFVD
jgi:alpha-L-fucosidase